ncbi:MAG: hypothetical protein EOP84_17460 [Verrucomicrobiaceae bacterium]|nr:MAG: hypothetical protein EOP84_17460 [Verrucomicrobiaceae bacterium]
MSDLFYVRPLRHTVTMTQRAVALAAHVLCLFSASSQSAEPDGAFFRSLRKPPEYSVTLDLKNPTDYTGIPEVEWFPLGNKEFCAIQGTVATTLKLPDGKTINEEFAILYIHRDAEGIYRVRADSLGWLRTEAALKRLDSELTTWATDIMPADKYQEREASIRKWMVGWTYQNEMYEGFFVRPAGYELSFQFFTLQGPNQDGIRYCYEVNLRPRKLRK